MKYKKISPTDLLALTPNESNILDILQTVDFATPVTIAKSCLIPRPTIYITLKKLEDRGLVKKRKLNSKTIWQISDINTIQEHVDNAKSFLLKNRGNQRKIKLNENTDIVMHHGRLTILSLFEKLIHKHGGNRLMGIQGIYAGDAWQNVFQGEDINRINSQMTEEGLITEIITSKDWFKRQVQIFGRSWAENFIGRTAQVHFIEDKYLNYKSQIFLFENQLYLVSMEDEIFIEIKNKEVSKLIISLIRFIEDHSKSIDINQMLADMLKQAN